MRALLVPVLVLLVAPLHADEHRLVSPNGEFEAYTIPANEDGSGMKLFLRLANSRDGGTFLVQNNRWIDVKWSPDSRFLAVIDHLDSHISDVFVFGVAASTAAPALLYHTPDLHKYDVKWEVAGWDVMRREIVLDKEVRSESPARSHEKVVARIGTEPITSFFTSDSE